MNDLTEWDIEQLNRLTNGHPNSGYIVETKTGLIGRTFHRDEQVNGKQVVHTAKGKLLCDPATLTMKGFID